MARKTSSKNDSSSEVMLNVIGYREDGDWVAVALEMDLRGYGSTFGKATADLADLVSMQMSFARFKNQPELLWRPAEPAYWMLFHEAT